jgi:hypothetical protein
MPKKEAPKKVEPKKPNQKKVDDLVKTIQGQLKDSVKKKYVRHGDTKPPKPTEPDRTKNLGELKDTDLKAAVKYAVEGKWQTDVGPSQTLKIRGDKMVKAVTNLKKTKPEQRD